MTKYILKRIKGIKNWKPFVKIGPTKSTKTSKPDFMATWQFEFFYLIIFFDKVDQFQQLAVYLLHFLSECFFFFFSTCFLPGLLPVLGPLGSGTDATQKPSPALRLLGCWWSWVKRQLDSVYRNTVFLYISMNMQPRSLHAHITHVW